MRVSDILDLLASGADRSAILADFDYLSDEDIGAALSYSERATEYGVVNAHYARNRADAELISTRSIGPGQLQRVFRG
jgi:hypothetical protein